MARNAVRWVAAVLALTPILGLSACSYNTVPSMGGYGDESTQPEQPNKGTDSDSCDDNSVTVAEGAYTYCSGQCAAKCPTSGVSGFASSVFKFTTTVPDDGEGKAGGWQEATATLNFFRWTSLLPEAWSCTVTVGMP